LTKFDKEGTFILGFRVTHCREQTTNPFLNDFLTGSESLRGGRKPEWTVLSSG
jgi:hypothetical protein